MSTSIRAEVGIGDPNGCPVAQASASTGATIDKVVRSSTSDSGGMVTEEFALDAEETLDHPAVEQVFGYDSGGIYRFERKHRQGCACECIERHGCPVFDFQARDGSLYVSFHASDVETVQDVVNDLHDWFEDIHVRRLTRGTDATDGDFVFVDRSKLTDRQREVLRTSFELGYFDYPKGANATDVAAELDISLSTFSEHLAAAQRKLLDALLET